MQLPAKTWYERIEKGKAKSSLNLYCLHWTKQSAEPGSAGQLLRAPTWMFVCIYVQWGHWRRYYFNHWQSRLPWPVCLYRMCHSRHTHSHTHTHLGGPLCIWRWLFIFSFFFYVHILLLFVFAIQALLMAVNYLVCEHLQYLLRACFR